MQSKFPKSKALGQFQGEQKCVCEVKGVNDISSAYYQELNQRRTQKKGKKKIFFLSLPNKEQQGFSR